jgi:3-deoxy-7-phosphoheptulonate synthase
MIAVLSPDCSLRDKAEVVRMVEGYGLRVQVSETDDASLVAVIGQGGEAIVEVLRAHHAVHEVRTDAPPYTLVARQQRPDGSRIRIDGFVVGGDEIVVMAGPCAVGEQPRPVLLKRGMMATIEELLLAAEYVVTAGNPRVMLCERGIRTYETATRNTLDIAAVPVLKERTHLPVIVDPSHAAGRREIVPALARAAIAAGADGLIVEVHPQPEKALSDGRQSLEPEGFAQLMQELRSTAAAIGRYVAPVPRVAVPDTPEPASSAAIRGSR